MTLPYPIATSQVDAKSPVDDNLMEAIRGNLYYLDSIIVNGGLPVYTFVVNGPLRVLAPKKKRIDMGFSHVAQIFTNSKATIKKSGLTGSLKYDLRYHSNPYTPITGIEHQYDAATQSIGQIAPAIATQSVTKATTAINTQTITRPKIQLNILSIINVGTNLWRYNVDLALDSDYVVGDSILTAGATSGANNGTFTLVEINQSGYPSFVVSNASGVAQLASAGTADLQLFSYNYSNPLNAQFVAGEQGIFAGHTSALNDGTFTLYKVNQAGNNAWVKNSVGVTQGSAAGTLNCGRMTYTYLSSVPSDFVVGEYGEFSSHTSGVNNGNFLIKAVNSGGNNLIVVNTTGVAQAGVAGIANTKRWVYSLPSDPTADVSVGQTIYFNGHTSAANNGTMTIVQVNRLAVNNLVVHNVSGVAQVGAVGNTTHTRKKIKFASDQSLIYSTLSYIEISGAADPTYNEGNSDTGRLVLEVNRGGGANYNVVIDHPTGALQSSPAGYIQYESRSLFSVIPEIAVDKTGNTANGLITFSSTDLISDQIPEDTFIGLYILEVPKGGALDLTVTLI